MKKLYLSAKYKKYHARRTRRQNSRRLEHKSWKKNVRKLHLGLTKDDARKKDDLLKSRRGFIRVNAPEVFSFINNTEAVVEFINSLKRQYENKSQVFIELEKVSEIDYSAIVVLLSIMVKFKAEHIKFDGSIPIIQESKDILTKSGFFDNLYKTFKMEDRYELFASSKNGIHTHAWKNVDSKLGDEIISSATKSIWGESRRCQGVQRALIELMQNTNNHADIGKIGAKHWWLSVNHDCQSKKVSFSFVDFGVGVFTSLYNKPEKSKFYNWF